MSSRWLGAILFLAAACAAPRVGRQAADEQNERIFRHLLKGRQLEAAARFSLYFAGAVKTPARSALQAQFALLTCRPHLALSHADHLPSGREKDLFRAATLALMSVERPWARPLLKSSDLAPAPKGTQAEILQKEVWADEWSRIRVRVADCTVYPILQDPAAREVARAEAHELFAQLSAQGALPDLITLGLAMDVGHLPNQTEVGRYLREFANMSDHPYYVRLRHWEDIRGQAPAKFAALAQRGSELRLSRLDLAITELRPQSLEVPWLVP